MARSATLSRLADLAQEQWGLVTRRQAANAGVPPATFARLAADGSVLERIANGVYRLTLAPVAEHIDLRAAWLQLAAATPAWERTAYQGIVSHRSAARIFDLGHLPADRHEFTLPDRRQSRRSDVRLHRRRLDDGEWMRQGGLLVTRPPRIASDLLGDDEDPESVAHLVTDSLREAYDSPRAFADALGPHALRFGLRRGDGVALLQWLLDLVGDGDRERWLEEAQGHGDRPQTANTAAQGADQ
jgi:hypothetical protein